MKKKLLGILLSIGLVLTMVPATVFAETPTPTDEPPATKTSQDVDVTTDGTTEDVEVDYTYLPESNTAEKVFNVTIDYTFPATLDAAGAQNTYTWDPTEGKYTKDETSTAESYTLSNEGAFEIKVTNHSNVNIDYVVSYAANDAAVFANALDGDMTNATGTVNTIAKGQTVGAEEIAIADEAEATADKTGDFNNATCTGKLKVTGINAGETPLSSGSDILGTFTIGISEKESTKTPGLYQSGALVKTWNELKTEFPDAFATEGKIVASDKEEDEDQPSYFEDLEGELVIDSSITTIGAEAFYGCVGLTSVTIPSSVTSIEIGAFSQCSITSATISKDIEYGDSVFAGCYFLTDVTIEDGVTAIADGMFMMSGVTSVSIPSSVNYIGEMAFEQCENLTSIVFNGTKEKFSTLTLGEDWGYCVGTDVVHCTDGDLTNVEGLTVYVPDED